MSAEQLYFIIGFLLGSMITGCLIGIMFLMWYETYHAPIFKKDE